MRIAYLINQYPSVSHTFIRREILALERLGFEVFRISIREWDGTLLNPEDRLERERTHIVLNEGWWSLCCAVVRAFIASPAAFFHAVALAWRMSRGAERPLHVHLFYFVEACCVRSWLRKWNVEHVHAHFGTNT